MGCGKSNHPSPSPSTGNCVCDVVQAIADIQAQAVTDCGSCPTSCFLEPLGGLVSPVNNRADTRVFMLLNKDGTPFSSLFRYTAPGTTTPQCGVSIFFRVEEVFDNCCATLRVLAPLATPTGTTIVDFLTDAGTVDIGSFCAVNDWDATTNCVTVDLSCFCAIQCVADVFLDICD